MTKSLTVMVLSHICKELDHTDVLCFFRTEEGSGRRGYTPRHSFRQLSCEMRRCC